MSFPLRNFHSEGALLPLQADNLQAKQRELFPAQSEPTLNATSRQQSSVHFDDTPISCMDLVHSAQLLEDIVSDVSIVKSLSRSKGNNKTLVVNDRILRIVYDTMKCELMPYAICSVAFRLLQTED